MKFLSFDCQLIGMLFQRICEAAKTDKKTPVDYVNPDMGGIGHLLSATSQIQWSIPIITPLRNAANAMNKGNSKIVVLFFVTNNEFL